MAILKNYSNRSFIPAYKTGGEINKDKIITKSVDLEFDLGWGIKKIKDKVLVAMSTDSTGLYKIGKDVEKFCGVSEADVIRDVKAGKDRPEDAIIYGMSNIMNGGKDIYFWTNATRLKGATKINGLWPAIMEIVSHECVHVARKVLTRALAKAKGVSVNNEDWITHDYGSGEYMWPAIGDPGNKKNPLIQIDEEQFATALGMIVQKITPAFLEMAKSFL